MLRDEAERMTGAARGQVVVFPAPEPDLSHAEKAWIHTCQVNAASPSFPPEGMPAVTGAALARCSLSPAHLGALRRHGWLGRRPRSGTIDRLLWDEAIARLDVELRGVGITH